MFEKQPAAGHGEVPAAGSRLPERMAAARATTELLGDAHELLWQAGTAELTELMHTLGALAARADVLRVAVAAEAEKRGVVAESTSASTAQWVQAHSPHVDPGGAHRIARLAAAAGKPANEPVTQALFAGQVSLGCADRALREVEKVAPVVPDADRAEVLGWFLDVAGSGGAKDMDRLSTWVLGRFAPDQLGKDAEKARRLSGIRISQLPGGLKRYIMDLGAEHAAVVDAALEPLSAPRSSTDPDTGEVIPDPRLAPQRRAEALLEVFHRAQEGDETRSVTGTTKVVVTINLDDLRQHTTLAGSATGTPHGTRTGTSGTGTHTGTGTAGTGSHTGTTTGTGRTREGELLDTGTIRRMACDAEIIPIVLGSESEPLDVGRQERLFTKGLRAAIAHRDKHCSFPGCDRPPTWCRAHHVKHWADGGKTCLLNAALLCERHHVIVHRDNLTATVTATGVTWHV